MAGREQFTNVDPATAAEMRRQGCDPHDLDRAAETSLALVYFNLPNFPVYDDSRLPPRPRRPRRRRPHHSPPPRGPAPHRLPSPRQGRRAHRRPLLALAHHLALHAPRPHRRPPPPQSPGPLPHARQRAGRHRRRLRHPRGPPGPFACVHLICSRMDPYRAQLARWLHLLAAKGVHDLVLVNRPWPREVPIPPTLFTLTTLTRLYVGLWKLPDAAALQGASFPHLLELGLCCVEMENGVVDSLVARSPVLEILNVMGCCYTGLRLRLVSQSLRCLQISLSTMDDIAVVKAPRLERFVLYASSRPKPGGLCTRVRIGDAPKLHSFGYLQPGQVLEIRDTIIMPGITASTGSMLTSVQVLSLNVRFGVRNDVKMVPTFLRCFPNLKRLHIMSEKCDEPTGDLTAKFWEQSGPIENVASRIKVMSFQEFKGAPSEVGFLEYIFQNALALRTAIVAMANLRHTSFSKDEALCKLRKCCKGMASKSCTTAILGSNGPEGGDFWTFQRGADFSLHDPFSIVEFVPA